jgi:peptidoglycan hydrolase-like protein with peptidoglycan-binding domain
MKRQGFRKSSVGLINPLFQSKEGNSFFRHKKEQSDSLTPSLDNDNFFDPMIQKVSDEKDTGIAVQSKEKEDTTDKLQAASEEEEPVQAKADEEEAVQKAGDEEEAVSAKAEEEEKVSAAASEEEPVQTKAEEEEPVQAKAEEEETVSTKAEEEEKVSAAGSEEEPVQSKNEEDTVQTAKEEDSIQTKESKSGKDSSRQSQVNSIEHILFQEKGKGMPMSPDTKRFMEKKFGSDFSKVRIHTDQKAQMMNKKIRSKAFAHGFDIFFNQGQYQPETKAGKHLLAHELTHTIQQKGIIKKAVQSKLNDGHDFHPTSRFSTNELLEDTFDNYATLKIGSNGKAVSLVQYALIGIDYRLPKYGADGSFGEETSRAVKAFQADMGLVVDGVVGRNTIQYLDRLDRGVEVTAREMPVTIDAKIDLKNVIAQAGAVASNSLGPADMGRVFPETIDVKLKLIDDGVMWHPVITGLVGHYSVQTRLLPGMKEVTGPGGNTSEENYCDQVNDLSNPGASYVEWFMEDAVLAHERFHASKMRTALIDPSVLIPLEKAVNEMAFPKSALTINDILAEAMIRLDPKFQDAIFEAEMNWIDSFLALVKEDHGVPIGTGPAYHEERKIVNPMIRKIRNHAKANKWSSCTHK